MVRSALAAAALVVGWRAAGARSRAERDEALSEQLASERWLARLHAAVSDVATLSADTDRDPDALFALVCERAAELLGADAAAVVRFDGLRGVIVGQAGSGLIPSEQRLDEAGSASLVAQTGTTARIDDYAAATGAFAARMAQAGLRSAVAAPVRVRGVLWGCIVVVSARPRGFATSAERLLERFASLVSVALSNVQTRAELEHQASTDGLTGLANHRAFQERLHDEHLRAVRHGRPLSLIVLDLDDLKTLNDHRGHAAGDEALREVARAFASCRRAGDMQARIGGDEFALIAPETTAADAVALAERLRRAAHVALRAREFTVTLSAGVCDLSAPATSPHDLFHFADSALYHAKHGGHDQTVCYLPDEHQLSNTQRERHYRRARTLTGLTALVRAVDAKDASTHDHAQRVANVAERLAEKLGWAPERCARLREAALLHDVGKIGIPDAVLANPGALTDDEYTLIKTHPTIGARITEEVLDPEQVSWVRHHHERPDGRGYPDGLTAADIPGGALVIGAADAFDAMTAGRSYQTARATDDVLYEMRALAGVQFDATVIEALAALARTQDASLATNEDAARPHSGQRRFPQALRERLRP